MRVLVFGAGALGTTWAGLLAEAGHDVGLLARGARLQALRERGPTLRAGRGPWRRTAVEAVATVDGRWDLAVVLVRLNHMPDVLPVLAANPDIAEVLVMVQNAGGYDAWLDALGDRLVVGFAGMGAQLDDQGRATYTLAPRWLQPTTLGEPRGGTSERVDRLVALHDDAGMPARACADMDAWQRWHASWITPPACHARTCEFDVQRIRASSGIIVRGMYEARAILRAAEVPLQPPGLWWLWAIPSPLLYFTIWVLVHLPAYERDGLPQVRGAAAEAHLVAGQLADLARRSDVAAPTWDAFAA